MNAGVHLAVQVLSVTEESLFLHAIVLFAGNFQLLHTNERWVLKPRPSFTP